jgi:hypothetical protein
VEPSWWIFLLSGAGRSRGGLAGAAARWAILVVCWVQPADAEICSLDGFSSIFALLKPSLAIYLGRNE